MSDYLINRTTALEKNIAEAIENRRRLTSGLSPSDVCGSDDVSLESLSQEIKLKSGLVVDLRSDIIDKEYDKVIKLLDTKPISDSDNAALSANAIDSVLKTKFDYVDKPNSWTQTPEQIEQMRAPVVKAFTAIFGEKDIDFNDRIDFSSFELSLNQSPLVTSIPAIFTLDKAFDKIKLLDALLKSFDLNLDKLESVICTILNNCLEILKRGQEISKAESIDLDKTRLVTMGQELKPYVNLAIGELWYGNSALTTTIAAMSDDLKILVKEPLSFVEMPLIDDKAFKLKNIITLLTNEDFITVYDGINRRAVKLNDRVKNISDKLFRISEELNKVPHKTTEGYYNFAVEDIARLISIFSGVLVTVQNFDLRVIEGIGNGYQNIVNLSNHLTNYRKVVEQYIKQRKMS